MRFTHLLTVPLVLALAVAAQPIGPIFQCSTSLSSLPTDAQGPISAALGKDDFSYWIHRTAVGFHGQNPQNAVTADFTKQGAEVRTRDLRWRLETRGYGYGDALHRVRAVAPHAKANRVEYRRNSVTEWYENGPLGLEQGFTLAHPPGEAHGRPLALELGLRGNVVASLDAGSKGLELKPKYGEGKLVYTGLEARDATGRELRSWLELRGNRLLVRIEDAGARYPVVVDPWVQQQELTIATGGANGDYFGISVAVSGKIVVVGAEYQAVNGNKNQGAAYVFVESGGKWNQQAELTAADGQAGDTFGLAVAISGSTAVVGASVHPYSSKSPGPGAAYVFVESDGKWIQQAELKATDGVEGDSFGESVAVSGSTAVIGATQHPYSSSSKSPGPGAAYVFVESAGKWTQQAELKASDGVASDLFGFSVGISGSAAVVGAPQHPYSSASSSEGPGAAYIFGESAGKWTQKAGLVAPEGADGDRFGRSVAISGSTVVAGAPQHTVGSNHQQGAAYVFVKSGKTWSPKPELTTPDGAAEDHFGVSVAISGSTAVVGAEYHTVNGNKDQGEAYVFSESDGTWGTPQELTATGGLAYDYFGYSVAISGSTPVVGALAHPSCGPTCYGPGAAYVFGKTSGD